ncbi:MAG: GtrA family protein [Oligoflexia bacterium]|nr:GtrA family protein [Oligoflexia bacterium]
MRRASFLASFTKSQVSAASGTLADFALLFGLVELFRVWYVAATGLGALAGAITNFLLNRHWSFHATHVRWDRQAFRYALVALGSMLLNSGGAYVLTDVLGLHYSISVVAISLAVGLLFNFPMHRYFVFR